MPTVSAAPKPISWKPGPWPPLPAKPARPTSSSGLLINTKASGNTSIASHNGWVQTCRRLIAVTPWVTSGITTSAQIP